MRCLGSCWVSRGFADHRLTHAWDVARPGWRLVLWTGRLLALLLGMAGAAGGTVAANEPRTIDFNRDVRPILSNACFHCHGPDEAERKADLRLDTFAGATEAAIVVGQPEASEFMARIVSDDPAQVMPPPKTGKKLSPADIATLRAWIQQGARYAPHWAYQPPVRVTPPPIASLAPVAAGGLVSHLASRSANPIDQFLLAELHKRGRGYQPRADRYTLARRVALDLTGLPPSWDEVQAFVADTRPDAYARYVDAQLAKPSYGEHQARMWLDLARYADSAGYADDPARTIWAYRDYVIRSFNANKPFDQFTIEQLAGDLLPNPTEEQLIATAFHRNTLTNNEGGTSDEEFRSVAVVDRVNTTFTVWMGTSIACAQCHTHKYDPITQTEFFQVYAILNNTADADRPDEAPVLEIGLTEAQRQQRQHLTDTIAMLEPRVKVLQTWQPLLQVELDRLKARRASIKPITTVPILQELQGGNRRVTRLHHRGNYQDLGEVVTEGVPEVFPPLPGERRDRLALAQWLVADTNPLTARVIANRYWEQIFGQGLVRTSEEFGSQGELPSHPELLDWLATELHRLRWDLKAFLKLLVLSEAYQQVSKVDAELLNFDPDNRWLSRGPRVRHTAEMVRDQALAIAGLLSPKMYGPSVRPPQPAFGLNAAFGRSMDWTTSAGDDKYRRGIYTEWRRTNPYPSMSTFDAPNRDVCAVRRPRTNTPLQALVTLNDPVYVEAAQAFARRIVAAGGPSSATRAAYAIQHALSRPATPAEVERIVQLIDATRTRYASDPKAAATLATVPLGAAPPGSDLIELAAWTVAANVILNLDELVMKR